MSKQIFLYDIPSAQLKKLSNYKGIDVSANFIEEESKIMFISDRLGYPNVFAMPILGEESGKIEQMVFTAEIIMLLMLLGIILFIQVVKAMKLLILIPLIFI